MLPHGTCLRGDFTQKLPGTATTRTLATISPDLVSVLIPELALE